MTRLFITMVATCLVTGTLFASGFDYNKGMWPKTWPQELEPLRKQSRTMTGGRAMLSRHEVRFTTREEFEAAWPHLLKVKASGAPIVLFRGQTEKYKCHVRVQCPAAHEKPELPAHPIPNAKETRTRWIKTTYLELYVDGKIVDLNRIQFPSDALIIDERFKDGIANERLTSRRW